MKNTLNQLILLRNVNRKKKRGSGLKSLIWVHISIKVLWTWITFVILIISYIQKTVWFNVKTVIYIEIASKIYSNPTSRSGNTYKFQRMWLNWKITFLDLMVALEMRWIFLISNCPKCIPAIFKTLLLKCSQWLLRFQIKVHYMRGKFGISNRHVVG